MGDGCFLYNPVTQSLGVSASEKLPILIVVFNNGKYAAMGNSHISFYPEGVTAQTGIITGWTSPAPTTRSWWRHSGATGSALKTRRRSFRLWRGR